MSPLYTNISPYKYTTLVKMKLHSLERYIVLYHQQTIIINTIFFITLIMHKVLFSLISTSRHIIPLVVLLHQNIIFSPTVELCHLSLHVLLCFPLSMCTHISHNTIVNLLPCVSKPQVLTTRVHSLSTERARVDPIELGHLLCAGEHLVQDTSVVGFTSA